MTNETILFYLTELKQSSMLSADEAASINFVTDCTSYFRKDFTKADFDILKSIYDKVQKRKGYGTA